jgi:hypothetical protein
VNCSHRSMEVSVRTMYLPTRWLVRPFGTASTSLRPSRTMSVTPTFYKNKFFFVHIGVHIKMHIKL